MPITPLIGSSQTLPYLKKKKRKRKKALPYLVFYSQQRKKDYFQIKTKTTLTRTGDRQ